MKLFSRGLIVELVGVHGLRARFVGARERDGHCLAFDPLLDSKFVASLRKCPDADVKVVVSLFDAVLAGTFPHSTSQEHISYRRRRASSFLTVEGASFSVVDGWFSGPVAEGGGVAEC